jgi:hypothetical protein
MPIVHCFVIMGTIPGSIRTTSDSARNWRVPPNPTQAQAERTSATTVNGASLNGTQLKHRPPLISFVASGST